MAAAAQRQRLVAAGSATTGLRLQRRRRDGRAFVLRMTLFVAATGCSGLSVKPMPERLNQKSQQACDSGWQHIVAGEAAVERQALLDAILVHQVWHRGVDRLHLRSEKQVGNTLVIMESDYDRADPDGDVFTVSVIDAQRGLLRREEFSAADVDAAICLYMTPDGDIEGESAAERQDRLARLAEKQARLERALQVFQKPAESPDGTEAVAGE